MKMRRKQIKLAVDDDESENEQHPKITHFGIEAGQLFKYSMFISLLELSSNILCRRTSIERIMVSAKNVTEKRKTN